MALQILLLFRIFVLEISGYDREIYFVDTPDVMEE